MFLCLISSHDGGPWKYLHTTAFFSEEPQPNRIYCTEPLNKDYTIVHTHCTHHCHNVTMSKRTETPFAYISDLFSTIKYSSVVLSALQQIKKLATRKHDYSDDFQPIVFSIFHSMFTRCEYSPDSIVLCLILYTICGRGFSMKIP